MSNWATILFAKPEMAKHLGKSYTFEAVHFQSTPTLIQALAANEIEVANLGFTSLPLAITNAKMEDLRIFADELQDGVPVNEPSPRAVTADPAARPGTGSPRSRSSP